MACVRASMPLSAVTFGGHDTVSSGSTTATAGRRKLLRIPTFIWLSVSVSTAAPEAEHGVGLEVACRLDAGVGDAQRRLGVAAAEDLDPAAALAERDVDAL